MITVGKLFAHFAGIARAKPEVLDMPVFISGDREGNSIRPMDGDFDILPAYEYDLDSSGNLDEVVVLWPSW